MINNTIEIEIKQNKEDMEEEREYTEDEFKNSPRFQHHKNIEQVINMKKMKEFDINLAKQGKPVCTRDGRKARIICFDKVDKRPIVALISDNGGEFVYEYLADGKSYNGKDDSYDLMMLPEKKEGWAKVRKDINLYDTKEEANRKMIGNDEYVTAKVCWEE